MRVWSVSVCHLIASAQRGAIYVLNRHPRLATGTADISPARAGGRRSSQASVVKPHTVKCVSSALETGVSRTESRSRALQSSVYNYTLFSCTCKVSRTVCAPRARVSLKLYRLCDRSLCLSVACGSHRGDTARAHRPTDRTRRAHPHHPSLSHNGPLERAQEGDISSVGETRGSPLAVSY